MFGDCLRVENVQFNADMPLEQASASYTISTPSKPKVMFGSKKHSTKPAKDAPKSGRKFLLHTYPWIEACQPANGLFHTAA